MHSSRSQSAMEYLMTYGWAILIIAVVLGVLFELGMFNPANFASKAQPGSCYVYRPYGHLTNDFINLAGECNNDLPEYVASFSGSGYISANVTNLPVRAAQRTAVAWFYTTDFTPSQSGIGIFGYGTDVCTGENFYAAVGTSCSGTSPPGHVWVDTWCTCQDIPPYPPSGWTFVVYEYNGTSQTAYVGSGGGQLSVVHGSPFTANTPDTLFLIGAATLWNGNPSSYEFDGDVANVQLYDTALSANAISALYDEGIGGAPINLQSLVGWWPLNGNTQDYSGNGYKGQISGTVTFTNQWASGYRAP